LENQWREYGLMLTNDDLSIGTTLIRQTEEYGPVECDITVRFAATMTSRGWRGSYWEPPEAAEFEVEFIGAEFDGVPSDAPGPLTVIEIATLKRWFDENEAKAWECANDNKDI
jgi:hypothetical protein